MMGCPDVLDPTRDATYTVLSAFLEEMAGICGCSLGEMRLTSRVGTATVDRNVALKAHNMTSSQLQQYFWK